MFDRNWKGLGLLVLLSVVLTLTLQVWVGFSTVYREETREKKLALHNMILSNEVPGGYSWEEAGAGRTNIRVFTIYAAEGINRATGVPLLRVYFLLDCVCLCLSFLLLYHFLNHWFSPVYCLVGILYFGSIAVLTYQFYYFHPWDRLSMLCWIMLLVFLRDNRLVPFAVLLFLSMTIKFDVLLLPVLYWLYQVKRGNWLRVSAYAAGLLFLTAGTYGLLVYLRPGAITTETVTDALSKNWEQFVGESVLTYPPVLCFAVPVILAGYRLSTKDRFMWTSCLFAGVMLVVFVLRARVREVRLEVPVLLLLMPAALYSLRALLEKENLSTAQKDSRIPEDNPDRSSQT